jgi:hypothetical protein
VSQAANASPVAHGLFSDFLTAGATISTLFSAESFGVEQLFETAGLLDDGGSYFQTLVNGPQTSPFTDIQAWLLTNQQLQNTAARVDGAIVDSVSLQQHGLAMAQDAVFSDWGRLDTVSANSQNVWPISNDDIANAANAFIVSTRQQIWKGYAAQLWTAGSVHIHGNQTPTAGQFYCPKTGTWPWVQSTDSGLPTGLGGIQYWPVQTISKLDIVGGRGYPAWVPYILREKGSATLAPEGAVSAIFQQPTGDDATRNSAGAAAPWFWPSAFTLGGASCS